VDLTPATRKLRPGRWGMTAGVACIALGLLSFNAFGVFTAAVNADHTTSTGDMELSIGSPGDDTSLTLGSTKIVPGDTITRTVALTVSNDTSTMSGVKLTTSGAVSGGSATLYTDTTYGLKIWIQKCSQAYTVSPSWDGSTVPTSVMCGGTPADVVGTTGSPVPFVMTDQTLTGVGATHGSTTYLKIVITFPSGSSGPQNTAQDAMEATDATLSFVFDGVQRNGSAH
jgi:hypothetical protein